jgi:hypothetical protein
VPVRPLADRKWLSAPLPAGRPADRHQHHGARGLRQRGRAADPGRGLARQSRRASGAAVQVINLKTGVDETTGPRWRRRLRPVEVAGRPVLKTGRFVCWERFFPPRRPRRGLFEAAKLRQSHHCPPARSESFQEGEESVTKRFVGSARRVTATPRPAPRSAALSMRHSPRPVGPDDPTSRHRHSGRPGGHRLEGRRHLAASCYVSRTGQGQLATRGARLKSAIVAPVHPIGPSEHR